MPRHPYIFIPMYRNSTTLLFKDVDKFISALLRLLLSNSKNPVKNDQSFCR